MSGPPTESIPDPGVDGRDFRGSAAVEATVPMASHVSVFVEPRLRKSISVCLKKFGVFGVNVDVLDSCLGGGAASLNRLSAADEIVAPKSNVFTRSTTCAERSGAFMSVDCSWQKDTLPSGSMVSRRIIFPCNVGSRRSSRL